MSNTIGVMAPQPPVVDFDHVLGPGAGREAITLLEAGQPVLGVLFADYEKRRLYLPHGERAFYLRTGRGFRVHG
jgi:hypothetical protein